MWTVDLLEETVLERLVGSLAAGLLKLPGVDADVLHVAAQHEVHLDVIEMMNHVPDCANIIAAYGFSQEKAHAH